MIVDTSAIIASIYLERERKPIEDVLDAADARIIGSPTLFEASLVLSAREGPVGERLIERFVEHFELEEIPFDDQHRQAASEAFLRFGKGRHPARLNLGDCMSYAIAKVADAPLLCVGDDFARTDLALVLPPAE